MSKNKRQSIADRYLAAIECGGTSPRTLSLIAGRSTPVTQAGSQSYENQITSRLLSHNYGMPEQDRGAGNSPSSSRRSRASKTPPRDPVEYVASTTKRENLFHNTGANRSKNGEFSDGSSLTSRRTFDEASHGKQRLDSLSSLDTDESRPATPTSSTDLIGDCVQGANSKSPNIGWRRKLEGTSQGMKMSPSRSFLKEVIPEPLSDASWIKKKQPSIRCTSSPPHAHLKTSPRNSPGLSGKPDPKPLTLEFLKSMLVPSNSASTAPTEVMTNLSRGVYRSPTQHSAGSTASTAVTTNRDATVGYVGRIETTNNANDENDSIQMFERLPLHAQVPSQNDATEVRVTRVWPSHPSSLRNSAARRTLPIVVQRRVDIESILSCSSTEVSGVRAKTPSPAMDNPVSKLGKLVGSHTFKKPSASSKASYGSSFQTKSISSSVGVETGGNSVEKGTSGLGKLLYAPNHSSSVLSTRERESKERNNNNMPNFPQFLLGPQELDVDEDTEPDLVFEAPEILVYRPSFLSSVLESKNMLANFSPERQSNASSNPFVMQFSSVENNDGIPNFDVPESPASSGWTPVALSSNGLDEDDFVNNAGREGSVFARNSGLRGSMFATDHLDVEKSPSRAWLTKGAAKLVPEVDPPSIRRITSSNVSSRSSPLSQMMEADAGSPGQGAIQITGDINDKKATCSTPDQKRSSAVLTRSRAMEVIARRRDERLHNTILATQCEHLTPSPGGNKVLALTNDSDFTRASHSPYDKIQQKDFKYGESTTLMGSEQAIEMDMTPVSSHSTVVQDRIRALNEAKGPSPRLIDRIQPSNTPSFMSRRLLLQTESKNETVATHKKLSTPDSSSKLPASSERDGKASRPPSKLLTPRVSLTIDKEKGAKGSEVSTIKHRKSPTLLANRFLSALAVSKKGAPDHRGTPSEKVECTSEEKLEKRLKKTVVNTTTSSVTTRAIIRDTSPFRGDKSPHNLMLMGAHLASRADTISSPKATLQGQDDDGTASVDVQSIRSLFEGSLASKVDIDDDDETIDSMDVKSLRSLFETSGDVNTQVLEKGETSGVRKMLSMFESPKPTPTTPKSFSGNNHVKEVFAKFEARTMNKAKSGDSLARRYSKVSHSARNSTKHSSSMPRGERSPPRSVEDDQKHPGTQTSDLVETPSKSDAVPSSVSSRRRMWLATPPTSGSYHAQGKDNPTYVATIGRKLQSPKSKEALSILEGINTSSPKELQALQLGSGGRLQDTSNPLTPAVNLSTESTGKESLLNSTPVNTLSSVADMRRKWMTGNTPPYGVSIPLTEVAGIIIRGSNDPLANPDMNKDVDSVARNLTEKDYEPERTIESPKKMSVAERVRALKAKQSPHQSSPLKSPNTIRRSSPNAAGVFVHRDRATNEKPKIMVSSEVPTPIISSAPSRSRLDSSTTMAPPKSLSQAPISVKSWSRSSPIYHSPQATNEVVTQKTQPPHVVEKKNSGESIMLEETEHAETPFAQPVASPLTNKEYSSVKDKVRSISLSQKQPKQMGLNAEQSRGSSRTAASKSDSSNVLSLSIQHELSASTTLTPTNESVNLMVDGRQNPVHWNQFKPIDSQPKKKITNLESRGFVITKKPLKTESTAFPLDSASRTDSEGFDDGVTLDLSIAEVSQLTNPTCLQSKEDANDYSLNDDNDSSDRSSSGQRANNVEIDGRGPSEASSSQTSEAAAPLIARTMKRFAHSDDGSIRSVDRTNKWEPITPVIDEKRDATWQGHPGQGMRAISRAPQEKDLSDLSLPEEEKPMDEAAWDLRNVSSSFPSTSPNSSGFEVDPFEVTPQPARRQGKNESSSNKVPRWKPFFHGDCSQPNVAPQPTKTLGTRRGRPTPMRPSTLADSVTRDVSVLLNTSRSPRRLRSPPAPIVRGCRNSPTTGIEYRLSPIGMERGHKESPATSRRVNPKASPVACEHGYINGHARTPIQEGRELEPLSGTSPSSLFGRTHPMRQESNLNRAVTSPGSVLTPTSFATERSTPTSHVSFRFDELCVRESPSSSPFHQDSPQHTLARSNVTKQDNVPTGSATSSKHAALLLRLQSLKEGRMRRSAFVHPSGQYPNKSTETRQQAANSVTTKNSKSRRSKSVSPSMKNVPVRPGVHSSQYVLNQHGHQYGFAKDVEDEQSQSTKSSTRFGGNAFDDCLGLD